MGHIVSTEGILPDPKKVQCVKDSLPPHDLKAVRRFLGLCGYYRRFIPDFAILAEPLIDLTRGDNFDRSEWSEECQQSFDKLKKKLISGCTLIS